MCASLYPFSVNFKLKLILLLWLLFVEGVMRGSGAECGLFLDKANVKGQATKKTVALYRRIRKDLVGKEIKSEIKSESA